jgi:hypothetical protein
MKLYELLTEQACGDCFKVAGRNMIDADDESIVLVHGTVTNIEGKTFPHAWNEIGDTVIDNSENRGISMPTSQYYELMNVQDPVKYERVDAIRTMARNRHWGPWK